MPYVDGFVVPVPKERIDDYEKIAREAGELWRKHGALSVHEYVADDVSHGERTSFPRSVQATDDETVIFSWIVFESREERDRINEAVMAEPAMQGDMDQMPFDGARMFFGGFKPLVEL